MGKVQSEGEGVRYSITGLTLGGPASPSSPST